jgi:quercetin dioxygenase-like cupin family protein
MNYLRTLACLALALLCSAQPSGNRMAFSHALPTMDGAHLNVKLVEVNYAPGASSPAHSHPCPVIGYVVEGALRFQVQGELEIIYKAGETFYEAPNGVHLVSANASTTAPAKLLAYFVCDHETPLSVAPPAPSK